MMASMTFDEALSALLSLIGKRVEVHVMDAGERPHLVATFGGILRTGHSMTGGQPSEQEAIFVRLDAGGEVASLSLDREVFRDAIQHDDGTLILQIGTIELIVARRSHPDH